MSHYFQIVFLLIYFGTSAQQNNNKLVDSLKYVTDMPYICEIVDGIGCGNKIFWKVVKQKQEIIPSLIDKLTDTTQVDAYVPNFGGQWTVADIAYTALEEIIKDIPTFQLLGIEFDKEGCGYCSYWNHLRKDIKNREKFQMAVQNWYDKNKMDLIWVTSNEFSSCDCRGEHPNSGHYELKRK
jgi:hypothetical protein